MENNKRIHLLIRLCLSFKKNYILYSAYMLGTRYTNSNFNMSGTSLSMHFVKLLFTTICFVGFYSVPNLIVIIFNLLYPVFIVGFHCKGCVIKRVVWRLKHLKTEESFAGISRLSIPRSISYALHMLECEESGQMETAVSREYLAGKAFPRDTCEAFCSASLSSLIHTFCTYTIYTNITHKWKESFWEKTLAKQLESKRLSYLQFSTHLFWKFSHLLPLHFHTIERLIVQTLTTPFESVK